MAGTAVAVAASLDMAHFLSHPLKKTGFIRDHNAALKYFRDCLVGPSVSFEVDDDELAQRVYEFPLHGGVDVRKMIHDTWECMGRR